MGRFIGKILVTALAALIAAHLLPGVAISNGTSVFLLALVLAFLNGIVKPILVILTIPITIITLGLFLLIINILIIKWASMIVPGFTVMNWWSALYFSVLLSFISYIINNLIKTGQGNNR